MTLPDLLAPKVASFATTFFLLLLAGIAARRKPPITEKISTWFAPAAGMLAGAFFVRGFPQFPPTDSIGWLWWVIALAALLTPFKRKISAFEKLFPPAAIAALSFLLLKPFIGRTWNALESSMWIAGTFCIWLAGYFLIHKTRQAPQAWQPLLLLWIAAIALAILLTLSGTLSYGLYALALSGVIAAPALWSISPFSRTLLFQIRPAAILVALPWTGLLLGGYFFAELPLAAALFALSALTTFALPAVSRLKRLPAASLFLLQLIWLIFPLLLAIIWTGNINSRF